MPSHSSECVHATVAAVRGPDAGGGAHVFAEAVRLVDIARAVVALLGAVLHAVAAVAGERAVGVARAVAAVVTAVVALLAGVLGSRCRTSCGSECRRCCRRCRWRRPRRTARAAARCRRRTRASGNVALAVGRARAGQAAVHAVVALLAEGGVDRLVAAVGGGLAAVVQMSLP